MAENKPTENKSTDTLTVAIDDGRVWEAAAEIRYGIDVNQADSQGIEHTLKALQTSPFPGNADAWCERAMNNMHVGRQHPNGIVRWACLNALYPNSLTQN